MACLLMSFLQLNVISTKCTAQEDVTWHEIAFWTGFASTESLPWDSRCPNSTSQRLSRSQHVEMVYSKLAVRPILRKFWRGRWIYHISQSRKQEKRCSMRIEPCTGASKMHKNTFLFRAQRCQTGLEGFEQMFWNYFWDSAFLEFY